MATKTTSKPYKILSFAKRQNWREKQKTQALAAFSMLITFLQEVTCVAYQALLRL